MSILKSNSISIDQQSFDEAWLNQSGIFRMIRRDPKKVGEMWFNKKQLDYICFWATVYDVFGMHMMIHPDNTVELRTTYTHYFGNVFESEILRTKGDVLRFLNTINVIIGDQS